MPSNWTFLTNHAHVLLAVSADPKARLRDIAERVGITERATQLIVKDLSVEGYLTKVRVGRRNTYTVLPGRTFRHPAESQVRLDELLRIFQQASEPVATGEPEVRATGS
jgi:DNA-binding Lrp family transcriptional regulator